MKRILTILSILIVSQLSAQVYDHQLYQIHKAKAEQFIADGHFLEATLQYDSALAIIDFYPYDYFNAFTAAFTDSNMQLCEDYLIKGTLKGLDVADFFTDEIDSFVASDSGEKFRKMKDSLLLKHYESIDMVSFKKLEELVAVDQSLRDRSPRMFYNDSLNFEALIRLSEERGFPTFPTVGYGCNQAWLLLWHHRGEEYPSSEQWQRILPYIQARMDEGLLEPDFLEQHDKHKMSN